MIRTVCVKREKNLLEKSRYESLVKKIHSNRDTESLKKTINH